MELASDACLCLPFIAISWVTSQGRPLLFLTEELSANLAKAMPRVIEAIREVLGDRRFCVIFDRGGYDGKLFTWLTEEKIDFITYQRRDVTLPEDSFTRSGVALRGTPGALHGRRGQDPHRGIGTVAPHRGAHQRRAPDPHRHQHHFVAVDARIGALMFARWRQENFFKYMGEHHGLDTLVSYGADEAVPPRSFQTPSASASTARSPTCGAGGQAERGAGDVLLDEPRSEPECHGLKVCRGGAVRKLRALEKQIASA